MNKVLQNYKLENILKKSFYGQIDDERTLAQDIAL